jgi:hypothetical protein
MRDRRVWFVAVVGLLVVLAACGSSGGSKGAGGTVPNSTTPVTTMALGTGVSATDIKVGVMLIDYGCVEQFVDSVQPDQEATYKIFIDDVNNKGGINGRKITPIFKNYCPVSNTGELSACTSLTEDNHVFAVMGIMYDPSGDAQLCLAKTHKTPIVVNSLTEALVKKAPAGLMVSPDIASERRLRVIMKLLKGQGTLNGKKVAIVATGQNQSRANSDVKPALQDLGVERGADAVLSITGSDTTAAQAQLDSFIEKWKSDGTNALILVGDEVSSKQFVEKIKKAIPDMLLVADTTSILDGARDEQKAKVSPNPYDGAISAEGQTGVEHTKTEHFAYCRDIWEKATGKKVPSPNVVVKLPNGKQNDIYGEVEDACLYTTFFATIAKKVGPYLNADNWVQTVNNFGPIDDTSTIYASIHKGKYDADDTYGLVAVDPTIGDAGDWNHITPVQNVTGG